MMRTTIAGFDNLPIENYLLIILHAGIVPEIPGGVVVESANKHHSSHTLLDEHSQFFP